MQAILTALGNKYFLYALIAVGVLGFFQMRSCDKTKHQQKLETYKRQLSGQLTDKERELQEANHEVGMLQSKLVKQSELAKLENEEKDKKFDALKKEYNLRIKSRDRTIAKLKQKIGGETEVVIGEECTNLENCVISYNWEDHLKRFKLQDPNIFEKGNEVFESEQLFKIYGEIYEQEDGSLQTRRLVLREVFQDEDGEYKPIPDAKADIIDSDFQYHNPPTIDTEWHWTDLFTISPIAVISATAYPDSGALKLGVGMEFFQWSGLGVNTHTAMDFKDIKKWEHRIGLQYRPTISEKKLNLAIGASAGTPYYKLGQEWSFNVDLLFYLW